MNIFVRHTFPMSKSSIKTKTVLTMTDMTESTELLAFKRQKDGYKVTVKISLCICVVLSWDELKVRQNLLACDYEIHIVFLLVATGISRHKSLQFVKTLTLFISDFIRPVNCFGYYITLGYYFLPEAQVLRYVFPYSIHIRNWSCINWYQHKWYLPRMKIFVYVELTILQYVTSVVTNRCFRSSVAVQSGLLLQRYWNL